MAACGPSSSRAHGSEQWAAWFGSRSNWLQFVSRCGDVCVAKSPRPMSTSTGVCLTAVVEVDVCVASEPHGLDERGSNESATVMVCTVVGPVAVGCSWPRFPAILWSRKILSLFSPSGGATHRMQRKPQPRTRMTRHVHPMHVHRDVANTMCSCSRDEKHERNSEVVHVSQFNAV